MSTKILSDVAGERAQLVAAQPAPERHDEVVAAGARGEREGIEAEHAEDLPHLARGAAHAGGVVERRVEIDEEPAGPTLPA